MDIDLLSEMVYDLILENDRVGLPGVGCFVAEVVPASFADRGYTINPPYRRLSFRNRPDDGSLLVNLYARSNNVGEDVARGIVTDFLSQMKEVLLVKKVIVFPGLGRLRATKENNFFFVSDENLDIYPEGFGLQPVSLKTRRESDSGLSEAIDEIGGMLAAEPAAKPAAAPAPEQTEMSAIESADEQSADEQLGRPASETAEVSAAEPTTPADETASEPTATGTEPATSPAAEQTTTPAADHPAADHPAAEPPDEPSGSQAGEPAATTAGASRRKTVLITVVSLAALAAAALGIFVLLARICPDFIDSLLYTGEELEILDAWPD